MSIVHQNYLNLTRNFHFYWRHLILIFCHVNSVGKKLEKTQISITLLWILHFSKLQKKNIAAKLIFWGFDCWSEKKQSGEAIL